MTRRIGFSTGALAFGDFRRGLRLVRSRNLPVVELSALRDTELLPLLDALPSLDLTGFEYISVHAPSEFRTLSEKEASRLLRTLLPRCWPIIIHPDALQDLSLWDGFGPWLCIENMDKRKPSGQTAAELNLIFARFPEASLCFDVGHARQVDPSMTEAAFILRRFGERLKQVHLSEVNSRSRHEAISFTARNAFRRVAGLIRAEIPIVLETIVTDAQIDAQLALADAALAPLEGADHVPVSVGDRLLHTGSSARTSSAPRS
jgi:hypothetical protein